MITERTLRKWRKEALNLMRMEKDMTDDCADLVVSTICSEFSTLLKRILPMTQELLDQHLLRREK